MSGSPAAVSDAAGAALERWRAGLSDRVLRCARRWELTVGPPYAGPHVSYTAPATTAAGATVVLKVQFPHREAEHEAAALRRWDGEGAIRLLDEDATHHALLLERADPGTPLSRIGAGALDVLIGVLPRLWVPAGSPFTRLDDEAARWHAHLRDPARTVGLDRGLVDRAVALLAELGPTVGEDVLVHQDLHGDNVLRARREPWLVIDPKPLAGERAFAVAPIVRSAELGHSRDAVRRRLDRLSTELDLDRHRARGWTIAQTMAWAAGGAPELVERHEQVVRWLLDP